jgi:hypothetical protein
MDFSSELMEVHCGLHFGGRYFAGNLLDELQPATMTANKQAPALRYYKTEYCPAN